MASFLVIGIGTIIVLLTVSAFLSGSETALTAVSPATMHRLEQRNSRAARCVNVLLADRERTIGAILLGNTFINILASSLATSLLAARYGNTAVASISTFASASMSATTCTTLITGKCFPITAR